MIGSLLANVETESLRYYMVLGITSAHCPLVDRARGDKRLRPWWHIGGGGGEGTPVIKAASLLPATIRLLGKSLK